MPKTYSAATLPRNQRPLFQGLASLRATSPTKRVRVSTMDKWGKFFKRQTGISKGTDHQLKADAPACPLCAFMVPSDCVRGIVLPIVVGLGLIFCFGDQLRPYGSAGRCDPRSQLRSQRLPIVFIWMAIFKAPLALNEKEGDIGFEFTSEKFRDEFVSMNARMAPEFDLSPKTDPEADEDNPFKGMQF